MTQIVAVASATLGQRIFLGVIGLPHWGNSGLRRVVQIQIYRLAALLNHHRDDDNTEWPAHEQLAGAHGTCSRTMDATHWLGSITTTVNPCPGSSQCLRIGYSRYMTVVSSRGRYLQAAPAWYQALDPDSYNLLDDKESFGVLWCRQKGCRNYYRYVKKPLVPRKDFHRDCQPSCLR